MKRLFIIGNGFDIAHGLNTRYSNFMEYLLQYEKTPREIIPGFVDMSTMSKDDIERHALYDKISRYISVPDLWNCFEDALGSIDVESIKDDNSCYMLGYGDDNWRDSAHHDYQYMINEELDFTDDIVKWFFRWIDTINTHVPPIPRYIGMFSPADVYMTFNYTDTLEAVYGIPESRINYIHGKARRDRQLVLGHHNEDYFTEPVDRNKMSEEEYENYCEYMSGIDVREQEADEIIESYFRRTYKDTAAIIRANRGFFNSLNNVWEIYIFGHSLSYVDYNYFCEIKNQVSVNCSWYISCFSDEDYQRAMSLIQSLDIKNAQIIP